MHNDNKSVSAIGLGCVTFGREIDQDTSFEMMNYAASAGITLFDTSPSYGEGVSEEIVGSWLSRQPLNCHKISVSTKIQPPFDPSNILDSVDQSLRRLKMNKIDIVFPSYSYPGILLKDLQSSPGQYRKANTDRIFFQQSDLKSSYHIY